MLRGWVVWPYAVLAAALVWRCGLGSAARRSSLAARVALVVYLGWLASETFFPLPVTATALHAGAAADPGGGLHADLVPFHSIGHLLALGPQWPALRLLLGNIVVFVPFGLLLPTACPPLATWRRTALTGLALSASIELGQLAASVLVGYSYRVTEIDDVILNVTGVVLGFAAWSALARRAAERRSVAPGFRGRRAARRAAR